MKERKLSDRISLEKVFFELSKVEKIVEKNGREYFATIPKRAKNMISIFSDYLSMV